MSAPIFSWKAHSMQASSALHWQFKGKVWHNWELHDNCALIASLKSKRFLSLLFEGSFEGIPIFIRKSLGGRVTIWLSETDNMIGELDYVSPTPVKLKMVDGRQYFISAPESSGKFLLSDVNGRTIAETMFNNRKSFAISAQVEIKSIGADDLNPWLAAVVLLYVAIANSYSNP